jgi:hypothetical protein
VKLSVFMAYLKAVGPTLSLTILAFYVLNNASSVGYNIWLSKWSDDASNPNLTYDAAQRDMRLGVYGALGGAQGRIAFRLRDHEYKVNTESEHDHDQYRQ